MLKKKERRRRGAPRRKKQARGSRSRKTLQRSRLRRGISKGRSRYKARRKKRLVKTLPRVNGGHVNIAMDRERLRAENEQHRQHLNGEFRIIDLLRKTFSLNGEAFIWEIYRQVLHREPDDSGFAAHRDHLSRGIEKVRIANSLLLSEEAEEVFRRAPSGPLQRSTIAGIMQLFNRAEDHHFVHAMYEELLCRVPDEAGARSHLAGLSHGVPRRQLVSSILQSAECSSLIAAAEVPAGLIQKEPLQRLGIFLGFPGKMSWDGEGIGRYVVRLAEGLLSSEPHLLLYVATTDPNFADVSALFAHVHAMYPGRLLLHHSNDMNAINQNIPVQLWYVPYVGMELAQELTKPIVISLHDLVYLHFPDSYFGRYKEQYENLHRIVLGLVNKASALVVSSDFIRENEGQRFLGLPPEKLAVIRPAAPVEEYGTFGIRDEAAFRQKYNLYGDYLVYPSVIRLHKNHDRLIEAFLRYKQTEAGRQTPVRLVLTDQIEHRALQADIEAVLRSCPDPAAVNSVYFLGRLPSDDLPSLYKYATGTITATLFEASCPFPILESVSVDTPVAYGRLAVIDEVIADQSAFVTFDSYNVDDMVQAIDKLYRWNKSLVPGQKAAIAPFLQRKWGDVAREYYSVFERVHG